MAFGTRVVRRDLDFRSRRGEIFVIMGDSGCGKSTLMRHMIGLNQPAQGRRALRRRAALGARTTTSASGSGDRFGVLYQGAALWSSMTLEENVGAAAARAHATSRRARRARSRGLKLALVGLAGFEDHYPAEISGGMRKRAGLARAMALDPEILYFDEPSAGLDPLSSRRLDDLILELRDSSGTTIVLVTHELPSIFELGDNAVFLDAERKTMIASGRPQDLKDSDEPKVRAFLARGRL